MTEQKEIISGAWNEKFKALQCCVLIPTYNNAGTIEKVINEVADYTRDIIVVNDGSNDGTAEILARYSWLQVVSWSPNKGKGIALRRGLKFAAEKNYVYAITIDSDGQHFADDLPWFIEKISAEPGSLIIGARNMEQSAVPGKSSLGNKISTFWFAFETGIRLTDTQSGYRLYPLIPLSTMRFYCNKYEFEIEVIVRAAWRGIPVTAVPVKVYYAPQETRVSHFRPFTDFTRVGLLNVLLVIIAVLYIKPRNFLRSLKKKNLRQRLREELFNTRESNIRKSCSVAFGIFMGIAPVWGYQMLIAISIAYLLRLNKMLVIVAANISLPPLIPVIIYLSYHTGALIPGQHGDALSFSSGISLEWIKHNMLQYLLGSILLGLICAICSGLITFMFLKSFRKEVA